METHQKPCTVRWDHMVKGCMGLQVHLQAELRLQLDMIFLKRMAKNKYAYVLIGTVQMDRRCTKEDNYILDCDWPLGILRLGRMFLGRDLYTSGSHMLDSMNIQGLWRTLAYSWVDYPKIREHKSIPPDCLFLYTDYLVRKVTDCKD